MVRLAVLALATALPEAHGSGWWSDWMACGQIEAGAVVEAMPADTHRMNAVDGS